MENQQVLLEMKDFPQRPDGGSFPIVNHDVLVDLPPFFHDFEFGEFFKFPGILELQDGKKIT